MKRCEVRLGSDFGRRERPISSAMVKRSIRERESVELVLSLTQHTERGDTLAASSLGLVEISRMIRGRLDHELPARIQDLILGALSGVNEAPIDESVVSPARRLGPASLRSLDAIHLATAVLLDADLVVAYDDRLLAAASELGFDTLSPGHL